MLLTDSIALFAAVVVIKCCLLHVQVLLATVFLQESCTFLAYANTGVRFLHHVSCKNLASAAARFLHLVSCKNLVRATSAARFSHHVSCKNLALASAAARFLNRVSCNNLALTLQDSCTC